MSHSDHFSEVLGASLDVNRYSNSREDLKKEIIGFLTEKPGAHK